jgi:transcriptional antiterminator NusG
MAEMTMQWYVLRAVSGKEAKVKEYIDAEIKNNRFNGNVAEVLIPTEKVPSVRSNGKRVVKERSYLPGYVLVLARLVGEIAHELRSTPNVLGFLGGLDNPTPLQAHEVERIMGKLNETIDDVEVDIPFVVGDPVKVTDGPFNGFSGVVDEVNNERRKLIVSVKVFGRSTPIDLSFTQVERE